MVFSYYGQAEQRDSEAVRQLSDDQLQRALAALAVGAGFPERGATAEDLRASQNLLIGEAIKRNIPVPSALMGTASAQSAMEAAVTAPPAPEAKPVNWALIVGGAAALYFVMKK